MVCSSLVLLLAAFFVQGNSQLTSSPQNERIYVGDGENDLNIILKCEVRETGNNDLSIDALTWNTFASQRGAHSKESSHTDGVSTITKTLKISSFNASKDSGIYKCSYKTHSAQYELIGLKVTKHEEEYDFDNKTIKSQTLKCDVKGIGTRHNGEKVEVEDIKWFQNDVPIADLKETNRFLIDENRPGELTIDDVTRKDANQYYARYTFKGSDQDTYNCSVALKAAPIVLDFDKSKNLIQDEKMVLQCKVLGFPKAAVTWEKDNKEIVVDDKDTDTDTVLSTLDGYKNAKLTIKSVDYDDAGTYACTASEATFNSSDTKEVVVRVKDKLAALWPFLGIVGEVIVLCFIIFIYEKRRNKQAQQAENEAQEADYAEKKGSGVRNRRNMK